MVAVVTMSDIIKKWSVCVQDKTLNAISKCLSGFSNPLAFAVQPVMLTNPVALFFSGEKSLLAYFLKLRPPKNYSSW